MSCTENSLANDSVNSRQEPVGRLPTSLPSVCSRKDDFSFSEAKGKLDTCWEKFDATPTIMNIIRTEDLMNKPIEMSELDKAAKQSCPKALQLLSTDKKMILLETGRSQYDMTCVTPTEQDKKSRNDTLYNIMCKCPACIKVRYCLYEDEDDDENEKVEEEVKGTCDPTACRECGTKLNQNGCPIEENCDDDHDHDDDRDHNSTQKFKFTKNGMPIYRGGMSIDETCDFMWECGKRHKSAANNKFFQVPTTNTQAEGVSKDQEDCKGQEEETIKTVEPKISKYPGGCTISEATEQIWKFFGRDKK